MYNKRTNIFSSYRYNKEYVCLKKQKKKQENSSSLFTKRDSEREPLATK